MGIRTTVSDEELQQADAEEEKRPFSLRRCLLRNKLVLMIIAAVWGGVVVGTTVKTYGNPSVWTIWAVKFPGTLMLSMIKCVILPLVVSSLVNGIAQLDVRHLGRIGGYALTYYMTTTVIAVATGIILVTLLKPGDRGLYFKYKRQQRAENKTNTLHVDTEFVSLSDALMDLIRNIFPENIVQASLQSASTHAKRTFDNSTGVNIATLIDFDVQYRNGTNILGIIVVAIAFGIALSQLGAKARPLTDCIAVVEQVSMTVIGWVLWYTPIGVVFLVAGSIMGAGDLQAMFNLVIRYFGTVALGISIHFFLTMPGLYMALTRKNPLIFLKAVFPTMTAAFGTSSSSATLPVSMRCLEEFGVDPRVIRFVLPLGATVNMDGTALYEAVGAIFIAQMVWGDLSIDKVLIVSLTATVASVGTAAVPHGGVVTMVMVLSSVGLPTEDGIAMILAVDWALDRFRTVVNVVGDCYGACVVNHFCSDKLDDVLQLSGEASEQRSGTHVAANGGNHHDQGGFHPHHMHLRPTKTAIGTGTQQGSTHGTTLRQETDEKEPTPASMKSVAVEQLSAAAPPADQPNVAV